MVNLFGFEIKRKQDFEEKKESFAAKDDEDGALNIQAAGTAGAISQYVDLDKSASTEAELITRYRQISLQPEVEYAVDEIVNEAIASDEKEVVSIDLDEIEDSIIGEKTKKIISNEFKEIINILNFNNIAYETFRRWIIDGRMYYHIIVSEDDPKLGIIELRYIDPRKIRKIREFKDEKKGAVTLKKLHAEYFIYNDKGFERRKTPIMSELGGLQGLKIAADSIIHVTSGLMDENNKIVYSYLHKAMRPMNMLRSLEDAVIIYYLSRSPERRVFYVDVGNLPKAKAEQYLNEVMTRFKNKLVYDQSTGKIRDDRKHMTMLEDFYLARRDGTRGTQVDVLQGGTALTQMMEAVEFFLKKLYKALNIPMSRLDEASGFSIGRASEITRDEVKFAKFISRLRRRFSGIFLQALEKQLILKGVITTEEWEQVKNNIHFKFKIDNHWHELKQMDIMMARMDVVERVDPFVGKYFSVEKVKKDFLCQNEDEIEEIDSQIKNEGSDEIDEPPPEQEPEPAPKPPAQILKIKHELPATPKKAGNK